MEDNDRNQDRNQSEKAYDADRQQSGAREQQQDDDRLNEAAADQLRYRNRYSRGGIRYTNQPDPEVNDSPGTFSRTIGIVALVCLFCCHAASIICGIIAMYKAKESQALNNGIKTTAASFGYLAGLISLILGILLMIVTIVLSVVGLTELIDFISDLIRDNQIRRTALTLPFFMF